jgi:putative tricarboxylic transport membrane protein
VARGREEDHRVDAEEIARATRVRRLSARLRALAPYLLVLAGAAELLWKTFDFGFTPRGDRPGPDVWPRAILLLAMLACGVRIVNVLRRPRNPDPVRIRDVMESALAEQERAAEAAPRLPSLLAIGIALTIAYVALLGTLGFAVDTAVYLAAMIRTGRYRRWPVIAAVAVGGSLVFMFVFMKIVYLSLPIGRPPFDAISLALMQLMGIR